ncbi:MAG: response regulator [Gammaproteobacteria bacterium]|nr:response regulator [Gammaproteobacteria bacterium]
MKLRTQISLLLVMFGLVPLLVAFAINVPMIFERFELLYQKAHLQNLRAEFSDLDQHLARRHEMARLLAKMPEPGLLVSEDNPEHAAELDTIRKGYVDWVNQVLFDQLDITRIFFVDADSRVVFWLDRDHTSRRLEVGNGNHSQPEPGLLEAVQHLGPGTVLNGPIVFDREAAMVSPNRFMQMGLVSPVFLPQLLPETGEVAGPRGSVVVYLDMGGLAQAYRGNYWVLDNGSYLDSVTGESSETSAFDDFQGLEDIFSSHELALWEFRNQQILWVPLFKTVRDGTLWVGRSVDASPLAILRNRVELIIAAIVLGLLVVVLLVARLIAVRTERFGHELTDGITRVLEQDEAVPFTWKRPEELVELGNQLTRLAETHAGHNQALLTYAEELETSNRYKSEFLANVSHELRTPLNSILLLSKMLSDDREAGLDEEVSRKARVIHAAGNDLRTLIDNILDLSRIEAGQMTLEPEPVDLQALLDSIVELMQPQFDAKQLDFKVEMDPAAPATISSDGDKVRQILLNFLSNAVKFTGEGSVTLRLAPGRDRAGTDYPVSISVTDTGIGIDSDKQALVFEAFRQADGSTNRRFGGTGLGLAISKELANLMGGDIELESSRDSGSTFTLFLPLAMSDTGTSETKRAMASGNGTIERAEPVPEADYGGMRVLLVDDDMRNLLALTPLLERWHLHVTAAGDGQEAQETLETDDAFSLVLLDIMMPGMDGYEVTRYIRQQPALSDLPVIALTARAGDDDRKQCLAAGADECIVKPLEPQVLKELLDRFLAGEPVAGAAGEN